MTTEELRQLVTVAGWTCRVKHDEVVLQACYFCGNEKYNLELSAEKGVYHCWACKQGGRLSELLRGLTGQTFHIPVKPAEPKAKPKTEPNASEFRMVSIAESPVACNYLTRRGIPSHVADSYGLGVCVEEKHRLFGRIVIPVREYWTGERVGWVGRSFTGKHPKYLATWTEQIITGWRVRDRHAAAVLVEGPLDGLAAHRAGYHAAVLSGVGGGGVQTWAARLPAETPVVILLDGDAAGQAQAERIYWQITPLRTSAAVVVVHLDEEEDPAGLGVDGVGRVVRQALSSQEGTHSSS